MFILVEFVSQTSLSILLCVRRRKHTRWNRDHELYLKKMSKISVCHVLLVKVAWEFCWSTPRHRIKLGLWVLLSTVIYVPLWRLTDWPPVTSKCVGHWKLMLCEINWGQSVVAFQAREASPRFIHKLTIFLGLIFSVTASNVVLERCSRKGAVLVLLQVEFPVGRR